VTLNARMSPSDSRLYNVGRDVAWCFGHAIMEVAKRCEEGRWEALVKLAKEKGVTDEELGKACQCLCVFVETQMDQRESMAQGLARCGFLDLNENARVIVMAHLGTIMLGMHWAGVRETTIQGVGPTLGYQGLRRYGRRCALLMQLPPWRRRLYNFWTRAKRAWHTLFQTGLYSDFNHGGSNQPNHAVPQRPVVRNQVRDKCEDAADRALACEEESRDEPITAG